MSIFIFYTSIHSILVILWLQTFTQNVSYDSWVILAITWSIIILIWSVQIKRDTKKNTAWVYLNKQQDSEQRNIEGHQEEVKNNMKLPF